MIGSQLDTGWLFFAVASSAVLLICLITFIVSVRGKTMKAAPLAFIVGAVALVLLLIDMFPFSSAYWTYVPVSGKVQAISSRILTDSGNISQKFAVEIHGQYYGCNDTRCSAIRKGDKLTILCEKQFELNGTPGYDCNWGRFGLNK